MSWAGGSQLNPALWSGTSQYVTKRQLQSTINAFYDPSTSTIDVSGNEVINITLASVSSLGFSFKPELNLDLGLGNALGGALAGLGGAIGGAFLGIGAGAGYAISGLATGVAGIFTPRNENFINNNNFETVNGTTQLQFSTLGTKGDGTTYSTFFRTTNAATPNTEFGAEQFISSYFTGGTKVARSVGDPLEIASASTLNSSIQAFGQWVPILDTDEKLNSRTLRADYNFSQDPAGLLISSGTNVTYSTVLSTSALSSYSKAQTWVNASGYYFLKNAVVPTPISPTTIVANTILNKPPGSWYIGDAPGTNTIYKVQLLGTPSTGRNFNLDLYTSNDSFLILFPTTVAIGGTFPKNPVTSNSFILPFGSIVNVAWTSTTATINNLVSPPLQESTIATAVTNLLTDSFETVLTTNNQYAQTIANPFPTSTYTSTYTFDFSGNYVSTVTDYLSTTGSTLAWTAPLDISGEIVLRLYGGGGGYVRYPTGPPYFAPVYPGAGGFVGGNYSLAPGSTVYFVVGEAGSAGMAGHPNGGMPAYDGGGGGGGTYMYGDASLSTILMVAGGGGGQGQIGSGMGAGDTEGGAGGGDPFYSYLGGNGDISYGGGFGADMYSGGGTSNSFDGNSGTFGLGGSGGTGDGRCGGGGGGYYGGGGGSSNSGGGWGGGGGSGFVDNYSFTSITGIQGGANNPAANGWVAIDWLSTFSSFTSTVTSTFTSTLGEYTSTFTAFQNLPGNLALQASTFSLGPNATTRDNKYMFECDGAGSFTLITAPAVNASTISTVFLDAKVVTGNLINYDAGYVSTFFGSSLFYEYANISTLDVAFLNAGVLVVSTTTETSFSTTTAALDFATISSLNAGNANVSSLQVFNGNFNTLSASTLTLSSGTVVNNANFSSINTDLLTFSTGTCVTNLTFSTLQSNGSPIPLYDIAKTTTLVSTNYNAVSSLTNNILNYTMNVQCNDQVTVQFGDNQQDYYTASNANLQQWASTLLQFNGENNPGIVELTLPLGVSSATFDVQRIPTAQGYASQFLYVQSNNWPVPGAVSTYLSITDYTNYNKYRINITNTSSVSVIANPSPYVTQNTNVFQIRQDINDVYISTTDRLYIQAGDTLISNQVNVPNLVANNANVTNGQFDQISVTSTSIGTSYTNVANYTTSNGTLDNVSTSNIQFLNANVTTTSSLTSQRVAVNLSQSTNSFIAPPPIYNTQTVTNPVFKRYPGDFFLQNQGNLAYNDLIKQDVNYSLLPGWNSSINYLVGQGQNNSISILDGGVVNGNFGSFQPFSWLSSLLTATFNSTILNKVILNNCPSLTNGAQFQLITGGVTANDFQIQEPDGSTSIGYGNSQYQFTWNAGAGEWNIVANTFMTPYAPVAQKGTVEIQQYIGSNTVNLTGSGAGGQASLILNGLGMYNFGQTFTATFVGGINAVASLTANISPDGTTLIPFNQYSCFATLNYFVPETDSFAINSFICNPQSSGGPNPVWQLNSVFQMNAIAAAGQAGLTWQVNFLLIPKGYFLNYL